VLIDEERWQRLATESARRGVAVAALVREAIDVAFPGQDDGDRVRALDTILHAPLMPVRRPGELREELDGARGRGL